MDKGIVDLSNSHYPRNEEVLLIISFDLTYLRILKINASYVQCNTQSHRLTMICNSRQHERKPQGCTQ
jgi:hypothetical protein